MVEDAQKFQIRASFLYSILVLQNVRVEAFGIFFSHPHCLSVLFETTPSFGYQTISEIS